MILAAKGRIVVVVRVVGIALLGLHGWIGEGGGVNDVGARLQGDRPGNRTIGGSVFQGQHLGRGMTARIGPQQVGVQGQIVIGLPLH